MNNHTTAPTTEFDIDPKLLKPLYKTNPFLHLRDIISNWMVIGFTMYFTALFLHPILYVLAIFIIGARMHALAILMHDASHFRFLKNRFWNDLITNFTIMYPVFTSIEVYRDNHLKHHRHLNSDHDPDWVAKLGNRHFTFPKTTKEFFITLMSYLVLYQGFMDAIWFLKRFSGSKNKKPTSAKQKVIKIGFYTVLFTTLFVTGCFKFYLLFWVVPYFSTFFMYQYIRSVAEHFGDLAYENDLSSSRTTKANWLEQFFIAPHNVGYHLDHHLFPGVPYYHLPQLHALLLEQPEYQKKAHITQGYTKGLLAELSVGKHDIALVS